MLRRVLFRLFWNIYDELGPWVLLSVTAFLLTLPVVTAPAAWGALLAAAGRVEREEAIGFNSYWHDLRRFAGRSTVFGLLLALTGFLAAVNFMFYTTAPVTQHWPAPVRSGALMLVGWMALFAFIGLQLSWAFCALQDLPLRQALRRGFLVLAAHPFAALAVTILHSVLSAILTLSVLGAVLLLGGLWATLYMGLAASAVEYYEEREDRIERERLTREGTRAPRELRALDEREAARQRRYDRTWREILKPWEYKK
jgi:uncharacterized membrane protein YesL